MNRLGETLKKIFGGLSEEGRGHARRMAHYVHILKPEAGEELIIASYGHDFGKENFYGMDGPILDRSLRERIARVDARNVGLIMEMSGYGREDILHVECMIANHENHEMKGCDSLSILRSADLYDAAMNKMAQKDWPAHVKNERRHFLLGKIPASHLRRLEANAY